MLKLILIPIIISLITQAIKLATDHIKGNFNFKHLMKDYGGMPSGHSAFVASLSTVVGLTAGFNSVAFAISIALLIIVVRDAVGFRRAIGYNAIFTNMLAKEIFKNTSKQKQDKIEYLTEQMGHTPSEVIVGLIIGVFLATLFYIIL